MPVSGFESVQSFGLARNIHAMVGLDLTASPIRISLSTDPFNYVRNFQRFAGIVVSAKVDGCYHHLRARSPGREKLEVCAPFATGALTEETV